MTALIDKIVALVLPRLWPNVEAAIFRILVSQARLLIQKAKDGTFPANWKFAEPFFDELADEILKLLPAEAVAATAPKLEAVVEPPKPVAGE